jgi:hypothetical protein
MAKETRVEVNEVDLGFCLLHVFYIIYPCGFNDQLRVYILKKNSGKINKMFVLRINACQYSFKSFYML